MFSMRDAVIMGGDFRQQITHMYISDSALCRLHAQVAPAAFHNSAQRIDAPRCHPNTRIAVKKKAHKWVMRSDSTTANTSVMWLSGGAGAGKSAIAQSLAEQWSDQGILLASFFFSRSDSSRNHVGALVATLVMQIYHLMPDPTRDLILQAIDEDPLIWSRDIFAQFQGLIANPLYGLIHSGFFQYTNSPRVLIIDGLDECLDQMMHGRILQLIGKALHEWRLPFLFIIASRPEPDIVSGFESTAGMLDHFHVNLSHDHIAYMDIELFLREKLAECRRSHPFRSYIPPDWPSDQAISTLVRKSSGHFIYASVTAKYVTSSRYHPHRRLEIILSLRPAALDTPFAELDALYSQILSSVNDFSLVRRILSIHILINLFSIQEIEAILNLEDGDICMALTGMSSLVSIREDLDYQRKSRLRVLHASLQDYLLDPSRSGEYHINTCEAYQEITIAVLSCLNHWPFDYNDSIIYSVCCALRTCFQKVTIDSRISEFMSSNFSFHLVYLEMARNLDSIYRHGAQLFRNMICFTVSYILATLDSSTSARQVSEKIRLDFDRIINELLDQSPNNNRLKLNIATISGTTILRYRADASLCLDEYFLDMTTPRTYIGSLPDFPLFYVNEREVYQYYMQQLRHFFTDASRSGKYAVCPDTLSGAAVYCIEYLQHCKHTNPARKSFPKWSPGVSTLRKSCPWKWRQKLARVTFNGRRITPIIPHVLRSYFFSADGSEIDFQCINWNTEMYAMALDHLPRLLPAADLSSTLVEMCKNAVFSRNSQYFPRQYRSARLAMREYLLRWGCPLY